MADVSAKEFDGEICCRTWINASPNDVYDIITSGDGWDTFFTNGTTVDARAGGKITFRWKDWGPDSYTTEAGGPVLEAVRPTRFVFQWGSSSKEGLTTISFALEQKHGGTVLTIRENGYYDTPKGRRMILECASGWGEAMTLLKFYLEHGVVYTQPNREVE